MALRHSEVHLHKKQAVCRVHQEYFHHLKAIFKVESSHHTLVAFTSSAIDHFSSARLHACEDDNRKKNHRNPEPPDARPFSSVSKDQYALYKENFPSQSTRGPACTPEASAVKMESI
ncbi:hypothetical protein AVEN_94535-1 [Araneus ventricosus]|uniref:Uncharacterized protein n=1 Tax=Araneus ventricosus TaxID=182803 RepID=A0A4Y2RSL2_ARAVE|nr:hypothetical protein AVEN_94535-1 [Araneus ventricosus]